MKILSGKLKYVVVAALGLLVVLTLRVFAQTPASEPDTGFVLKIKTPTPLKGGVDHFKAVLKTLSTKNYDFDVVDEHGKHTHIGPGGSAKLDIKTDKVTASELAKSGELTLIQVHATQHLSSPNVADIKTVLNEF
jgi:hypothetical protein